MKKTFDLVPKQTFDLVKFDLLTPSRVDFEKKIIWSVISSLKLIPTFYFAPGFLAAVFQSVRNQTDHVVIPHCKKIINEKICNSCCAWPCLCFLISLSRSLSRSLALSRALSLSPDKKFPAAAVPRLATFTFIYAKAERPRLT